MGNYRLTDEARKDIIRIHQWGVRNYGEAQGDRYYFKLIERFEELADSPLHYPVIKRLGDEYRRSVCGVGSIYYRIVENDVEIMAIIGRQNLDDKF